MVFIGRVREKTPLFRTEKSRDADGRSYPWIKSTGMVDYYYYYYYYYYVAADFGPFFLEFCSSIPLQRQTLYQRHHWPSVRPRGPGSGSPHWHSTTRSPAVDDPVVLHGDLRPAHRGTDRCAAAQVAGDAARSVPRRRPGR
ncbi:hypothetical protein Rwratislav_27754 [Rhodococcus wratislaviensis IFP 2016]|nr:hypothetical protein Rwratislav_27754 [Rhodococcus wratislaviensis IFP 2016]